MTFAEAFEQLKFAKKLADRASLRATLARRHYDEAIRDENRALELYEQAKAEVAKFTANIEV